ncbi:MAG: hypothetical protein OHK0023_16930 [Anaerolineae bacterium]
MYPIARTWQLPPESLALSADYLAACDGDAFLARILLARGMNDPASIRAYLNPDEYVPMPPEAIPDLAKASDMLAQLINTPQRVLIWGDFDVDGQTATALLYEGLKRLGIEAAYYIPNRAKESHGIKIPSLKAQLEVHKPSLLLTCDTGISEHHAVKVAQSLGVRVIVTDHHELEDTLPPAECVVNPKRLPEDHPLRTLPGVGVAYKLMQHLYTSLDRARELPAMLDLVVLGIVADVAEQVGDTRYLLQRGMDRLQNTTRVGLNALFEVIGSAPQSLSAERIGFSVSPRLNAAGRMGDASLAVDLLTTSDRARALAIAQQMEALNESRKLLTQQIEGAALDMLEQDRTLNDPSVVVLHHPEWNIGILGVVANRLAEVLLRPIVLLGGGEDGFASGSARSFGGVDIHAALSEHADMLRSFGGHSGAAGLSLAVEQIPMFRAKLARTLATMGVTEPPPLQIDALVPLSAVDADLYTRIGRLSPFGPGNPPIVLATLNLRLSHAGRIGRDNRHWKLTVEDSDGTTMHLLWWNSGTQEAPTGVFDAAYTISMSDRGEVQAEYVAIRQVSLADAETEETPLEIGDYRRETNPEQILSLLLETIPQAQVWAEAFPRREFPHFRRRAEIAPCESLIIYSIPPDLHTLRSVLRQAAPKSVQIIGVHPPLTSFEDFLHQVTLAVKNALDHMNGSIALDVLCGAAAASPDAIRAALDYLHIEGQITYKESADGMIRMAARNGTFADREAATAALDRLRAAYEESENFRRYFKLMPLKKLLMGQ